jgi:hypothetical protein
MVLLKWAFAIFGLGFFIASMTSVYAYVAQGAIARPLKCIRQHHAMGLNLIVASPLPRRDCPCGSRDLT